MVREGERAPDWKAKTTDGRTLSSAELRGRPYVMFFFPKAFTSGCTIETKQFAAAYPELQGEGVEVLGVSSDEHETQCRFAESTGAKFPMIGDADSEMAKAFGVKWPLLPLAKRVTFVVDADGIARGVFRHEMAVNKHLEDVRRTLASLPKVSPP
jgi:peroxiredoxin